MKPARPTASRKRRFRIPQGAAAEALLAEKIRVRRTKATGDGSEWRLAIARKNPAMSYAEFVAFRFLHGQFEGRDVPLLPTVVRLARFVVKGLRARLAKATP